LKIDANTTALVTGANGGIGAAIARALTAAGAKVILSGRRPAALAPLAAEIGARVIVADLAVAADVERLAAEAGDVDIVVLNAAVPASGLLFDHSAAQVESIMQVNLTAPILTSRTLGAGMLARKKGQIVLISSVSGMVASPGASLYAATKFGLRGFALSLRGDLAHHGVGVTTIFPGFIREAGMFAKAGVKLPSGIGTRSPEDVAAAVLYAVRSNPAEITVAALDQRFVAFFAGLAPGVIDYMTARLPMARQLAADVSAGQKRHAAEQERGS
jgi:short-subunit dehydrogenase